MMKRCLTLPAAVAVLAALQGCTSPFSELQSARLVEKGRLEGTVHYSAYSFFSDGDSEKAQDDFGLQLGYGVSDEVNLRFRYERASVGATDPDFDLDVWAFGPKIMISRDKYAFYLPIGFATGEDIEWQETFEMHPTLLQTIELSDLVEVNTSLKYILRFDEATDPTFAFDLGLGIGRPGGRVVLRPETGILVDPGSDGLFWHWSVGLTLYQ